MEVVTEGLVSATGKPTDFVGAAVGRPRYCLGSVALAHSR